MTPPDVPPPPAGSLGAPRPLIVRLRNWVGDVVLSTPLLQRLDAAGYALTLVGKPWALDLLAGFGWPILRLGSSAGERIEQLRSWRLAQATPGDINGLSLPYSFSSAWEMRRAGLRALGYDGEGRALLLRRSLKRPHRGEAGHELAVYWRLGQYLLEQEGRGSGAEPPPPALRWQLAPAHIAAAHSLMAQHGLTPGFLMLCPFAGGTFEGLDKRWPAFQAFAQAAAATLGRRLVLCPGPGEEDEAQAYAGSALVLPGVSLGTCAGLLHHAGMMISNDTGPGHLAAAVGTPVLSVLGPTVPEHWGAWGPNVHTERHWPRWPTVEEVLTRARALLQP